MKCSEFVQFARQCYRLPCLLYKSLFTDDVIVYVVCGDEFNLFVQYFDTVTRNAKSLE